MEHQIFRFAEMILCDRCSTLDRRSGKIVERIGMRPSALHSTLNFCRKSHRIVSFLMLSTWKIEEVSQNCLVFDAVYFGNWRRSRRIVLLSILSSSNIEVSHTCFVFDAVKFQN